MQLSTLVLPAPLGPIRASSSAGATLSEIPSRTVSPPKARCKSSMASSAIPPPIAAVLLDLAIAAALSGGGSPEVELGDVGVLGEPGGAAVEHDAAIFQDIAVVDDAQGQGRVLLDDQQRQGQRAADGEQALQEIGDDDGGEPQRQFVDEQQFGVAHERGGNGQHLPLAARQQAGRALA